ncbi:MAG: class I SAM-dependent methyltransferase [Acidimicrobiales bacterium]
MEPTDFRIAALYDLDNPGGPDHEYYRRLTDGVDPDVIIDLGCGTGSLTVTLARPDREVIGIDPDAGMLDVARRRPGSGGVRWILGDSEDIGGRDADLVLMTGNVAQHIRPNEWTHALANIAAGLRSGGTLCFETRNPTAAAWQTWAAGPACRDTAHGPLTEWSEVSEPDENGTVLLTCHNIWTDSNDEVVVTVPLTFRSCQQLTADLTAVGLEVSVVYGSWRREPLTDESALIVVEAIRN